MLINKDGLVLIAQRIDQRAEAWQMPQGGVEDDETPSQAAMRELEEEIGTNRAEIIAESEAWKFGVGAFAARPRNGLPCGF